MRPACQHQQVFFKAVRALIDEGRERCGDPERFRDVARVSSFLRTVGFVTYSFPQEAGTPLPVYTHPSLHDPARSPLDGAQSRCYNLHADPRLRKWRNWQTRTFEGRVEKSMRVQVPPSASGSRDHSWEPFVSP